MNLKKMMSFVLVSLSLISITTAQSSQLKELDINLENYDYPFPVHFITLNNQHVKLEMAYMDVHPEHPNGKNILLLHGKNFNGAYWEQTAKRLADEGFRVIIPDQIGFGKSTKPANYQYTFQQLALNTKAILDSLGIEQTSVLGHSMGGMLATRFVLMFPERTDKFILENPIGLEDWKLKVPYKPVDWWYQSELKKSYEGIKKYQLESYYDNKWKPEYDEWVNLLAGWTLNTDYPIIAWNAALTYDMIFTQPVCYEFKDVTAPTLLIIGQRDRTALGKPLVSPEVRATMGNYPELGRQTQREIKGSQLVEIDNIGHLPHIEAFDRFIEPLVKFLKE
ncbi:alpha/beta fold hydrolase [Mangrovibacterium lignilyticum]|uniref:alpha/beta fold hydrolase n=1 Tax=Mangrovibacterium lignilyticum TaxID=2668052 RepID=UPI001EE53F11|nr:alpha/beta hydrolase [Mangrovibacterium lignilyticum]